MTPHGMIWEPGRDIKYNDSEVFRIPDVPLGRILESAPTIVWEVKEPDWNRLWSNTLNSIIKFTEEGARQFGIDAAAEIRRQIANFSKPTQSGAKSEIGSFTPHEKLDLSGQSLYQSIGWTHFEDKGDWKAEAGPGIGRGKSLPVNVDGESYANFVEKGTKPSRGRFVPKVVDLAVWNVEDPTRFFVMENVPKTWVPKMGEDINVLLEGWWAAERKRVLLKKRHRGEFGRYATDPGSMLWKSKYTKARQALAKARPTYKIGGSTKRKSVFKPGWGLEYSRTKMTKPPFISYETLTRLKNQMPSNEDFNEFIELMYTESEKWTTEILDVMGGGIRGSGGIGNILRSVGDVGYAMFTIDLRLSIQDVAQYRYPMLDGAPGFVSGAAINERGLGLRIGEGMHPGTPARNYMHNAAANMRTKLKDYINQARTGGGIVKGKEGNITMFENW